MENSLIFYKLVVFITHYGRAAFYFLAIAVVLYLAAALILYAIVESITDGSIFIIGSGIGTAYGWYRFNVYRDIGLNFTNIFVGLFLSLVAMLCVAGIMDRLKEEEY